MFHSQPLLPSATAQHPPPPSSPASPSPLSTELHLNSLFPNIGFPHGYADSNFDFWLSLLSENTNNNHQSSSYPHRSLQHTQCTPGIAEPTKPDSLTGDGSVERRRWPFPAPEPIEINDDQPPIRPPAPTTENPSSEPTGTKNGKRSRTSPPRPPNAFILYRKDLSSEFLRSKTGKSVRNGEVSKLIAEMWKNESETVRKSYYLKAAEAKRVHAETYPKYKYRPARGGVGGKHRATTESPQQVRTTFSKKGGEEDSESPASNPASSSYRHGPMEDHPEPPPPLPPPPDVRKTTEFFSSTATGSEPVYSATSVSPAEHEVTYGRTRRLERNSNGDRPLPPPPSISGGPEPIRRGGKYSFFDFSECPPPTPNTSLSDTARTIAARLIQRHPEIQAVLAEAYLAKYLENHRWVHPPASFHPNTGHDRSSQDRFNPANQRTSSVVTDSSPISLGYHR